MTYSSKLQIFGVPMASLLKARAKNGAEEVHAPSPQSATKKQSRLLTFNELKTLKGISYRRITLKRLEDAEKFPKRIKIGARVYWYEHEIDEWIQSQANAR